MQNKKIQFWALSIAGYNCTIEYIAGTDNVCADLLSHKPDGKETEAEAEDEPFEVTRNDNTFEDGVINSNEIDTKQFASYEAADNHEKDVLRWDFMDVDMSVEQASKKDSIISSLIYYTM